MDGKPGPVELQADGDYLGDVLSSGRHLLQLINDILDLAKVEAGKIKLLNPSPLRKAIAEVCAVTGPLGAKERIRVSVEFRVTTELKEVTLDAIKFKQVAYNLLSNALKFTDSDGS